MESRRKRAARRRRRDAPAPPAGERRPPPRTAPCLTSEAASLQASSERTALADPAPLLSDLHIALSAGLTMADRVPARGGRDSTVSVGLTIDGLRGDFGETILSCDLGALPERRRKRRFRAFRTFPGQERRTGWETGWRGWNSSSPGEGSMRDPGSDRPVQSCIQGLDLPEGVREVGRRHQGWKMPRRVARQVALFRVHRDEGDLRLHRPQLLAAPRPLQAGQAPLQRGEARLEQLLSRGHLVPTIKGIKGLLRAYY